jgi:SMC interacting uncharacterized protein involved in chromosome segregation
VNDQLLDTVIEQGLLILFLKRCQTSMSINDAMLEEAEKTADTIVRVRDKFQKQQQQGTNSMQNPFQGMAPPIRSRPKAPKVTSNEQLLETQVEALKNEVEELTAKLTLAYAVVEDFRTEFGSVGQKITDACFDLQAKVYQAISGAEGEVEAG